MEVRKVKGGSYFLFLHIIVAIMEVAMMKEINFLTPEEIGSWQSWNSLMILYEITKIENVILIS